MSIVNRRNAMMGWAVWTVGKQVMKQKAKSAVSPDDGGGSRRNRAMLALGAVVAAAATRGRSGRSRAHSRRTWPSRRS